MQKNPGKPKPAFRSRRKNDRSSGNIFHIVFLFLFFLLLCSKSEPACS